MAFMFTGERLTFWRVRFVGGRPPYAKMRVRTAISMFQFTAPLQPGFHAIVFGQGLVGTLFFGWLALCLPEMFPTQVRATGSGLAYNAGRFATAFGVLGAGALFQMLGGDYPRVGTICACIYALGVLTVLLLPRDGAGELGRE